MKPRGLVLLTFNPPPFVARLGVYAMSKEQQGNNNAKRSMVSMFICLFHGGGGEVSMLKS